MDKEDMVNDYFGVKKFYKTKPHAVQYYADWKAPRTISSNGEDTVDPRLQVTCSSTPLSIGGGIATWNNQSSGRMYVNRGSKTNQWLNTEQTIYVKNPSEAPSRSFQLRFRANHHGADNSPYGKVGDVSCGFGNYLIKFGEHVGDNLCSIEVEYVHGMYKRHVKDVTLALPYDKWIGLKGILRNTDENHINLKAYVNLKVESQVNWRKVNEFTFSLSETDSDIDQDTYDSESPGGDGDDRITVCLSGTPSGDGICQNTRSAMIAKKIFNRPAYWNWFRVEDCENFQMKYYSVREINPKSPY